MSARAKITRDLVAERPKSDFASRSTQTRRRLGWLAALFLLGCSGKPTFKQDLVKLCQAPLECPECKTKRGEKRYRAWQKFADTATGSYEASTLLTTLSKRKGFEIASTLRTAAKKEGVSSCAMADAFAADAKDAIQQTCAIPALCESFRLSVPDSAEQCAFELGIDNFNGTRSALRSDDPATAILVLNHQIGSSHCGLLEAWRMRSKSDVPY